jgi:hypothetical protein
LERDFLFCCTAMGSTPIYLLVEAEAPLYH